MLPNWIYYFLGKKSGGGSPTPTPSVVVVPNGMKFAYSSVLPDDFNVWDFSNVYEYNSMFYNSSFNEFIFDFPNISNITCSSMFSNNSRLINCVLNFNINSTIDSIDSLFASCSKLENVEINNLSGFNSTYRMFYRCSKMESAPQLDTSKVKYPRKWF